MLLHLFWLRQLLSKTRLYTFSNYVGGKNDGVNYYSTNYNFGYTCDWTRYKNKRYKKNKRNWL